jgi:hypothetical protein
MSKVELSISNGALCMFKMSTTQQVVRLVTKQ